MTQLAEVTITYGGPGNAGNWLTRTFWRRNDLANPTAADIGAASFSLHLLFDAIKAGLSTQYSYIFPSNARVIDEVSGTLVADIAGGGAPTVVGTDVNDVVSGVGTRLQLQTEDILHGRHVHGSMWIGPLCTDDVVAAGDLSAAWATLVETGYGDLASHMEANSISLCVYHRNPKDVLTEGHSSAVTGSTVQAFPAFLARRRT